MTQEALKQMYQLLLTEPHAPTVCAQLERIAREALAEHAMSEVQRLGQEIEPKIGCVNHDCDQCKAEQEPICPDCKAKVLYECVACSSNNYPPKTEQEKNT